MLTWSHDPFACINDLQNMNRIDLDVIDWAISFHLVQMGDVGVGWVDLIRSNKTRYKEGTIMGVEIT